MRGVSFLGVDVLSCGLYSGLFTGFQYIPEPHMVATEPSAQLALNKKKRVISTPSSCVLFP